MNEEYCDHCAGFGSSLKDPHDVAVCSQCGGSGLMADKIRNEEWVQDHYAPDGSRRDA